MEHNYHIAFFPSYFHVHAFFLSVRLLFFCNFLLHCALYSKYFHESVVNDTIINWSQPTEWIALQCLLHVFEFTHFSPHAFNKHAAWSSFLKQSIAQLHHEFIQKNIVYGDFFLVYSLNVNFYDFRYTWLLHSATYVLLLVLSIFILNNFQLFQFQTKR